MSPDAIRFAASVAGFAGIGGVLLAVGLAAFALWRRRPAAIFDEPYGDVPHIDTGGDR